MNIAKIISDPDDDMNYPVVTTAKYGKLFIIPKRVCINKMLNIKPNIFNLYRQCS